MLESQRQPTPRNDRDELDTALAFLTFARECVLKKVDGLTEEQLRARHVASETNLLGLVQHLADGERWWLSYHLLGDGRYDDLAFSMVVDLARPAAEVVADYRAAIAESDANVRAVADLEALAEIPVDGQRKSMRWVLAHLTSETARHAGHADILRELTDGVTGR